MQQESDWVTKLTSESSVCHAVSFACSQVPSGLSIYIFVGVWRGAWCARVVGLRRREQRASYNFPAAGSLI